MTDLIKANSSKGTVTVTEHSLNIHLPGSDRTIARTSISEVRIGLGLWYGFGFARNLTLIVTGERSPVVLGNMKKAKAIQVKSILGF